MGAYTITLFSKRITLSANWVLIIFTFLNLLFKFYYLPQESIYGDEGYSIFHAQKSLSELTPIFLNDQNPPLHIALLHFWMKIFGVSDISAKAFSVICSVLCGIGLFVFATKFLNKQAAVIVSILFLFSNVQLFYSHEVRTYALVEVLCIASFYCYFKLLKEPDKKTITLLAFVNLLLLYSHYLSIFIFIVQFVGVWMYYKTSRKSVLYYLISQIIVALAFAPWVNVLFSNLPKNGSFWLTAPQWGELKWFVLMMNGNGWLFIIFSTTIVASFVMIALNKRFNFLNANFDIKVYFLFLLLYILPIALDYWVAQYTPVFLGRYFLYTTLGLFLLIAYIISNLSTSIGIRSIIFLPILYCLIISFDAKPEKEDDWKSIVPKVKKMQTSKTIIYVSASYKFKEFSYYYDREAFKDYKNTLSRLYNEHVYCAKEGEWGWDKVNLDSVDQILFVQSHSKFEDPEGKIRTGILNNHFKVCSEFSKINITITAFKKDSLPCFPVTIIQEQKAVNCDFWDISTAVREEINDTVKIYNASMELDSACAATDLISQEKAKSGYYSCKINAQQQFSIGIVKTLEKLEMPSELNVSAFVNYKQGSEVRLVISVEKAGEALFRQELILTEKFKNPDYWNEVSISTFLPEKLPTDAELKIYFWNPSKTPAFIDDFVVQIN